MALREDYYTPCVEEINQKIREVESLIDELELRDIESEFGIENSAYEDELGQETKLILNILEEVQDKLIYNRRKLALSVSEVWYDENN